MGLLQRFTRRVLPSPLEGEGRVRGFLSVFEIVAFFFSIKYG